MGRAERGNPWGQTLLQADRVEHPQRLGVGVDRAGAFPFDIAGGEVGRDRLPQTHAVVRLKYQFRDHDCPPFAHPWTL